MTPASIEWIDSCDSTNTLLKQRGDTAPHGHTLAACEQTAGRGQRGNTWEAEAGKNLTFSMMLRPTALPAARQFDLSMLTSLAILTVLKSRLGADARLSLKWPNDIYAGDRKLGGILIEGCISGGMLQYMVLGVGINVNQTHFVSDAPNPVSMAQIAGHDFDSQALLQDIVGEIVDQMAVYEEEPASEQLQAIYMQNLWRREGFHPYRDAATGERFEAEIAGVLPDGRLRLRLAGGGERDYEFKQVAAII